MVGALESEAAAGRRQNALSGEVAAPSPPIPPGVGAISLLLLSAAAFHPGGVANAPVTS